MLKVNIDDLTFDCIIGILPHEREKTQKVIINISFEYFYDTNKEYFIDYSEVASLVETSMIEQRFKLIEDAILFIRKKIKENWKLEKLKVKISKPDIMPNCKVSVEE